MDLGFSVGREDYAEAVELAGKADDLETARAYRQALVDEFAKVNTDIAGVGKLPGCAHVVLAANTLQPALPIEHRLDLSHPAVTTSVSDAFRAKLLRPISLELSNHIRDTAHRWDLLVP